MAGATQPVLPSSDWFSFDSLSRSLESHPQQQAADPIDLEFRFLVDMGAGTVNGEAEGHDGAVRSRIAYETLERRSLNTSMAELVHRVRTTQPPRSLVIRVNVENPRSWGLVAQSLQEITLDMTKALRLARGREGQEPAHGAHGATCPQNMDQRDDTSTPLIVLSEDGDNDTEQSQQQQQQPPSDFSSQAVSQRLPDDEPGEASLHPSAQPDPTENQPQIRFANDPGYLQTPTKRPRPGLGIEPDIHRNVEHDNTCDIFSHEFEFGNFDFGNSDIDLSFSLDLDHNMVLNHNMEDRINNFQPALTASDREDPVWSNSLQDDTRSSHSLYETSPETPAALSRVINNSIDGSDRNAHDYAAAAFAYHQEPSPVQFPPPDPGRSPHPRTSTFQRYNEHEAAFDANGVSHETLANWRGVYTTGMSMTPEPAQHDTYPRQRRQFGEDEEAPVPSSSSMFPWQPEALRNNEARQPEPQAQGQTQLDLSGLDFFAESPGTNSNLSERLSQRVTREFSPPPYGGRHSSSTISWVQLPPTPPGVRSPTTAPSLATTTNIAAVESQRLQTSLDVATWAICQKRMPNRFDAPAPFAHTPAAGARP